MKFTAFLFTLLTAMAAPTFAAHHEGDHGAMGAMKIKEGGAFVFQQIFSPVAKDAQCPSCGICPICRGT